MSLLSWVKFYANEQPWASHLFVIIIFLQMSDLVKRSARKNYSHIFPNILNIWTYSPKMIYLAWTWLVNKNWNIKKKITHAALSLLMYTCSTSGWACLYSWRFCRTIPTTASASCKESSSRNDIYTFVSISLMPFEFFRHLSKAARCQDIPTWAYQSLWLVSFFLKEESR